MAGEHPSIARASYVRCEEARLVQTTDLQRLIDSGKLTPTQAASPALVAKVQAALGASRETKLEIQAVLRTQGFT